MTEPQILEGYLCACGEKFPDKKSFNTHQLVASRKEKGVHKSMGRVNMSTGEVTMPPYMERDHKQKKASQYAVKKDNPTGSKIVSKPTEIISNATQISFVPRVYTSNYTPIMQAARAAAINVWGWRPDMPIENFFDTCLFNYFYEHGIELGAYAVKETEEQRQQRELALAERAAEEKEPAEVAA
jgi:hypothetical protein